MARPTRPDRPKPRPDQGTPRPDHDPLSADERRERVRTQVKIVVEALGGKDGVAWACAKGDDPADFDYLYRPSHILVRDESLDRVRRVLDGGEPADNLISGVTLLRLPPGLDTLAALERIDRELGAGVATPDHILYVTRSTGGCCPATEPEQTTSRDPLPPLSKDTSDGSGVLVSVIDTGWHSPAASNPRTPWLDGVVGDEETIDPAAIHPYAGHGTFVAGVVRCISPSAEVRVEGFLPHGGAIYESAMVVQLHEALAQGPDIISMSAGTHTRKNQALLGLQVFWETSLRHLKGTVLVAAAGNDGDRLPFWPAAFPWSVSVGALTHTGARAHFSNFGSWVDVYALGVDLVNAYPSGVFVCHEPPAVGEVRKFSGMAQWSGTSFSTPTVAGIIAARMTHTGESAQVAADAVLALARAHATPGVGATLTPGPHNNDQRQVW